MKVRNDQVSSLVLRLGLIFITNTIIIGIEAAKENGFFVKHQTAKKFRSVQGTDAWARKQEPKRVEHANKLKASFPKPQLTNKAKPAFIGKPKKVGKLNLGKPNPAELPTKKMNSVILARKSTVLSAFNPKHGNLKTVKETKDKQGNVHKTVLSNKNLPNILMHRNEQGKLNVYKMPKARVAAVLDKNNKPVHLDSVYKNEAKVDFKKQGRLISGDHSKKLQNRLFNPPTDRSQPGALRPKAPKPSSNGKTLSNRSNYRFSPYPSKAAIKATDSFVKKGRK